MIIACPACFTRYVVPDSAIGIEGRTVRCAKCRHSWFQDGPRIEAPVTAEPVPAPQTPAPEPRPETATPAGDFAQDTASPEPAPPPPANAEPAPEHAIAPAPPPIAYGDDEAVAYGGEPEEPDDSPSSFGYAPPFRPRRNVPRLLMIAAIIFAAIALSAAGWIWRYGMPDWVPLSRASFAEAQPDLVLDFPPRQQARRALPDGTTFFEANGSVTNVGATERSVPAILIVMRDSRDRIVYSWEVTPPKRRLAPGERININEAVTDVPKSAVAAEIGWKPG